MDYIQIPNDFQLNKLIFLKESSYSEQTKKSYWGLYLSYIADLEIEYTKDLYDFSQDDIDFYKKKIKDKSNQTILQCNAFINKYMIWYVDYYNKPIKIFDLTFSKEVDSSWYIGKVDFFKICSAMIDNTTIDNITPLIFARYGILGKQLIYMRNIKWQDIDFENKEILIRDEKRKIISYIPIDDEFLKWITMLKEYEQEKYKNKSITNKYIIKTQIQNDEIVNYNTVNSKAYLAFNYNKIKRISFSTLFNCAIIDHLKNVYKNEKLKNLNEDLIKQLSIFYPEETLTGAKIADIKKTYTNLIDVDVFVKEFVIKKYESKNEEEHILIKKSKSINTNKNTICSIEECNDLVYAKKLCKAHYEKQRKVEIKREYEQGNKNIKSCKVNGCQEISRTKGYCSRHYKQVLKHGEIISVEKKRQKHSEICKIENCNDKTYARGYCEKHYRKHLRYGNPVY